MSEPARQAEEDARLEAVRAVDLEEARPALDRIAFLVQCFAGTPIAQVEIIDGDQVWRTGVADSPIASARRVGDFANRAIDGEKVLWVADATLDRRYSGNPMVTGDAAIRFYAGAPIRLSNGARIGAVSIMDRKPRAFDAYLAARLEDFAAFVAEEWDRCRALQDLRVAAAEASALNNRMIALIETAPVALVMTDRDLRIQRVSPRWLAERGMEGDNVIGKRLQDLFPGTHEQREAGYEAALQGETVRWDRVRLNLPNGQRPWIRGEVAPWRDADGAVAGLLIKSHDITDMVEAVEAAERSEQRLRLATEMAELLVWEADYSRRKLTTVGGSTLEHMKVEDGADSVDRDLWRAVHPADRPAAEALWRRHLTTGAPFRTTYRLTQPNGPHKWVAAAAEAVWGEDGEIGRIVGVLKNIDREKRYEQSTAKALEVAESANRAKSDFLANMSHEIRSPLNGVMGIASVLGRTDLTAAQREMVDLIGVSAQALEALLSDVLDLARIESGRLDLRDEPFDLADALKSVSGVFEAKADDKGLTLKTVISPAAKTVVRGDAIRLRQIVSNLLSNAVKFTDEGKLSMHVEAERIKDRLSMRLSVIDTGIGFDAEVGRRLFQRFEQPDGSITRRFGGAGLGLAISQSLADAMGGVLVASSTPGQGAVFSLELELPCAEEQALDLETPPADAATAVSAVAPPSPGSPRPDQRPALAVSSSGDPPLRILLAEDHPTNRKIVSLILQAIGAELTSVENGEDAVRAVEHGNFDLILMDVQMPVMDGLTAIKVIREWERLGNRSHTPILALTANAMAADARASEAAGADGHLTKPIAAEKLIAAIRGVRRTPQDLVRAVPMAVSAG
jgi:PAS domain S-box-containing protein